MSETGQLCIFARAPEVGQVKTRLAAAVGPEAALAAHRTLVERCLDSLRDVAGVKAQLWIAGPVDHPECADWSSRWGLPLIEQHGDDLGARMGHAVEQSLQSAPFAIVIGTDCPTLDADYVVEAVTALADHDMVLGPAEDGGYGLIGLRRRAPLLFSDMVWGTPQVASETLARAKAIGLSVRVLDPIWDVDRAEDWRRFLSRDQS